MTANSRSSPHRSNTIRSTDDIEIRFEDKLKHCLTQVARDYPHTPIRAAVAFSGGLDSSTLLHLCARHAQRLNIKQLFAFHIHHGLSPNADGWLTHCQHVSQSLSVPFGSRRVTIEDIEHYGIEEAARRARYAALTALCQQHGCAVLLTAHHRDDQAETVLLQLLRGSGVAGLAGMADIQAGSSLLRNVTLIRPLLDISRSMLENYVHIHGLRHVCDESNTNIRFARNAVRQRIFPIIESHFPGFAQRLARSAENAQSAQNLLDEIAQQDWKQCSDCELLDINVLTVLNPSRQANLLRHWIAQNGFRIPSKVWLDEAIGQLLHASNDAQPCVACSEYELRRFRGQIFLLRRPPRSQPSTALSFSWSGEPWINFEHWQGRLVFQPTAPGISTDWLKRQPLHLRPRTGGERLRLSENRPSRDLKHHFQEQGIPPWERTQLPVLWAGEKLLFVAELGCHQSESVPLSLPGIQLVWKKDAQHV